MLIDFTIENFGSIRDKVKLSFEASSSVDLEAYYIIKTGFKNIRLLKIGILYGYNASGKTTILNALDFLRNLVINPFEKKTDLLKFKQFLFCDDSSHTNSIFCIKFIQNNIKYDYKLEFNQTLIIEESLNYYNPNKANVFHRTTDIKKQLSTIRFGGKIKINNEHKSSLEANTLSNNTVLGGFLKTNFESFELQEATEWFNKKLKPMIKPNSNLLGYVSNRIENNEINKENVIELLKKADFNISDIIINKKMKEISIEFVDLFTKLLPLSDEKKDELKNSNTIEAREIIFKHIFEKGKEYLLPYNEESSGTQRYYQLCGLLDLMIRNEAIFPIDELESSLHPDLLIHFILTFLVNSKNSQLIVTTHYRELLLEKNILRNDAIWFTEKLEEGNTDLFSLNSFGSSVLRGTSSIYNAYKIGKLGATPNLKDTYIDLKNEKTYEQKKSKR